MRLLALLLIAVAPMVSAETKPLRVLLVTGGCCHDYATQRKLLEEGLKARANVEIIHAFNPSKATNARFEVYEKEDWHKGFDVVIHDECTADIKDEAYIERILKAHRDGVPAVNLHCAMHSYGIGKNPKWVEFLGLQTTGHGPQEPIEVVYTEPRHPITVGLEPWTTGKEELYNNVSIPEGTAIIRGRQTVKGKTSDLVMGWATAYGPNKTRVFGLTLGHNNETVADARYLDLVTRGLLWSAGKLGADGKPLPGYGPGGR
jgi:type 1 glutamine amidotransferase